MANNLHLLCWSNVAIQFFLIVTSVLSLGTALSAQADDISFQIELAEHSHKLGKNAATLATLIDMREQLVASRCMPKLTHELKYAGGPTDQVCLSALRELLKIDPENPVAACAQAGIDDPICRARFSQQRVRAEERLSSSDADLGQKLASSQAAPRIEEIRRALAALDVQVIGSAHSPETRQLYTHLRRELLDASCRLTGLRFEGASGTTLGQLSSSTSSQAVGSLLDPPISPTALPTMLPSPVAVSATPIGPMEALLAELSPTVIPSTATPLPRSYQRIRLLPMGCAKAISDILRVDPQSSAAICHRDGFYSPACIDALRRERRQVTPKKKPAGPKSSDNGVSRF